MGENKNKNKNKKQNKKLVFVWSFPFFKHISVSAHQITHGRESRSKHGACKEGRMECMPP